MSTDLAPDHTLPRWPWAALLAVYLLLAVTFSIIQPLGRTPDEAAHVTYLTFLADHLTLPIWEPQGGGEAGYEAQHPPLYYSVMAVVYRLTGPLAENWRWQVMRWFTILLIGLPLFVVCRRFFTDLWGEDNWYPFLATASVMLMPMTLLYTAYINPDALAMLFATLTLWLAWRARVKGTAGDRKQAALLGLVAGLATLAKLSGMPAVVLALAAHVRPRADGKGYEVAWADLALTLVVFAAVCGWWFGRNAFFYGTPFIHTTGMMGTGLHAGLRFGLLGFAWLTWKETYLSSWAQRGWFPDGFWNLTLYGVVVVATVLAIAGLVKQKRSAAFLRAQQAAHPLPTSEGVAAQGKRPKHAKGGPARPAQADQEVPMQETPADAPLRAALNFSGLLLTLVFLGQQWAYWTVDVEFNAGGRYILVAMMGLILLLVTGLRNLLGSYSLKALWAWLVCLLIMNQVSIWCIWALLNPRYCPGWQVFHFPGR